MEIGIGLIALGVFVGAAIVGVCLDHVARELASLRELLETEFRKRERPMA
jgi:hypothetical protein